MGGIVCKRCHGTDYVKRGTVRNLQRYQCKACGCNFTDTPPRGKPPAMKALALMLYAMGNMSFCSGDRRERGPAKHVPGTEPGKRVTGAGPRATSRDLLLVVKYRR
jgi:transposase-like protein